MAVVHYSIISEPDETGSPVSDVCVFSLSDILNLPEGTGVGIELELQENPSLTTEQGFETPAHVDNIQRRLVTVIGSELRGEENAKAAFNLFVACMLDKLFSSVIPEFPIAAPHPPHPPADLTQPHVSPALGQHPFEIQQTSDSILDECHLGAGPAGELSVIGAEAQSLIKASPPPPPPEGPPRRRRRLRGPSGLGIGSSTDSSESPGATGGLKFFPSPRPGLPQPVGEPPTIGITSDGGEVGERPLSKSKKTNSEQRRRLQQEIAAMTAETAQLQALCREVSADNLRSSKRIEDMKRALLAAQLPPETLEQAARKLKGADFWASVTPEQQQAMLMDLADVTPP